MPQMKLPPKPNGQGTNNINYKLPPKPVYGGNYHNNNNNVNRSYDQDTSRSR